MLWENYTEAQYRDIRITSADGSKVYFSGLPEQVKTPDVAPHWTAFGDAGFSLVKGDAVNMDYAQKIVPDGGEAGIFQGPQDVEAGETFVGSVYAKGTGRLKVGLMKDGAWLCSKDLGTQGAQWRKLEFELPAGDYSGDADFAIAVSGGEVTVDQASLSTATGRALGGFRPDILEAVKQLHPTCLRWPGGGYVAQYNWKWGIGPQEERQRWAHWMWLDYDQNAFGTDEFIRFCREIDTEPVIVVSVGFDRPESEREQILQNACDWVAYCNEPATGKWGSVRAANGHPEPYNVKYWEIDNELNNPDFMFDAVTQGRFTSEEMAAIATDMLWYASRGIHDANPDAVAVMETMDDILGNPDEFMDNPYLSERRKLEMFEEYSRREISALVRFKDRITETSDKK